MNFFRPEQDGSHHPLYFQWGVFVVTALIIFTLAVLLRGILTPVLIALVFAYIADPLLHWFEQHRIRRWIATTVLYAICLGIVITGLIVLGPKISTQARNLYSGISRLAADYGTAVLKTGEDDRRAGDTTERPPALAAGKENTPETQDYTPATNILRSALGKLLGKYVPDWERRGGEYFRRHLGEITSSTASLLMMIVQNAVAGLSNAADFVFGLILMLIFTFFFMLHFRSMMETLRAYIPARYRTRILRITGKIDTAVAHFFRGRLLICVISGVIYVTGLKLSGIDFWLLIGIAGGILSFIPFLGVVLPIIPACILAVLTVHPWLSLLGVLMTFSCVQWVIEPLAGTWILSQEVKLHPVTILLAMLIGGTLFGAFGIILSVPLAATVKILGEEFILPPLRELAHPAPVDSMHREADKTSS